MAPDCEVMDTLSQGAGNWVKPSSDEGLWGIPGLIGCRIPKGFPTTHIPLPEFLSGPLAP